MRCGFESTINVRTRVPMAMALKSYGSKAVPAGCCWSILSSHARQINSKPCHLHAQRSTLSSRHSRRNRVREGSRPLLVRSGTHSRLEGDLVLQLLSLSSSLVSRGDIIHAERWARCGMLYSPNASVCSRMFTGCTCNQKALVVAWIPTGYCMFGKCVHFALVSKTTPRWAVNIVQQNSLNVRFVVIDLFLLIEPTWKSACRDLVSL